MLEAANARPRFTISLKRSTQNLQLSTSRRPITPSLPAIAAKLKDIDDVSSMLLADVGKLPFNTDGGGLCNNHPANRGSMTKMLEAVRQLRGEAHPAVQVKNCDLALAQGTGFQLATRHGSATMIMERE